MNKQLKIGILIQDVKMERFCRDKYKSKYIYKYTYIIREEYFDQVFCIKFDFGAILLVIFNKNLTFARNMKKGNHIYQSNSHWRVRRQCGVVVSVRR